jgi:hypothetical protein
VEGKLQRFQAEGHRTAACGAECGWRIRGARFGEDAPVRSMAGGAKYCAAERPVLGARFILRGCARQGILEV